MDKQPDNPLLPLMLRPGEAIVRCNRINRAMKDQGIPITARPIRYTNQEYLVEYWGPDGKPQGRLCADGVIR